MNKFLPILGVALATGSAATVACTITSTTNENGTDGGTESSTGDDTGTGGGDTGSQEAGEIDSATDAPIEAAPPPSANIRFANWSPDAPAAGYDLCVAPHGQTSWQGPVLAQAVGDAGALTFAFPTVTTYFQVDVGQVDVEIVAAGGSCASPIGSAITNLKALAADQFYTLALVGDTTKAGNDPTLTAVVFQDDAAPTDGSTAIRFLDVAPDLAAMDFGAGTLATSTFVPMEVNVGFASLATQTGNDAGATVDANGYVDVTLGDAAGPVAFSCHTSQGGTTDTATASNQTLAANSAMTLALVNGKNGGAAAQFLVCTGDGAAATSLTSTCTVVTM